MKCFRPITLRKKDEQGLPDFQNVPCGKCEPCLQQRRSEWSFRIQQELKISQTAYFLTLTLDSVLARRKNVSTTSLDKTVVQKFLKRLRYQVESKDGEISNLRYYAIGEYGTVRERAHYHMLLFNLPLDFKDKLPEIWGLGIVDVGKVEPASIHYVTGYVIQRYKDYQGRTKPFALMSTKPALGHNYLKKKQWHLDNNRFYVMHPGGIRQAIPRYYRDKIFTEEQKQENAIKSGPQEEKKYQEEKARIEKLGNNYNIYLEHQQTQIRQRVQQQSKKTKL